MNKIRRGNIEKKFKMRQRIKAVNALIAPFQHRAHTPIQYLGVVAHDEAVPRRRAKGFRRTAGHQKRVQGRVVRRLRLHDAALLWQRHFPQASQSRRRKDCRFHGKPACFTPQRVLIQPSDIEANNVYKIKRVWFHIQTHNPCYGNRHAPFHRGSQFVDFVDCSFVLLLHFPPHGARASARPGFRVQVVPHVLQVPLPKREGHPKR